MSSPGVTAASLTLCAMLIFENFVFTLEYQILTNKKLIKRKYVWKQQPLLHVQFKTFIKKLGHENFMAKHKRSKRDAPNETVTDMRNFTKVMYQVPVPMPMYAPPSMVFVPMRTVFEPVIHDHPPLHKIREIIDRDERKYSGKEWRPKYDSASSSGSGSVSEEGSSRSDLLSSTSTSSSEESSIDYYDTVSIIKNA